LAEGIGRKLALVVSLGLLAATLGSAVPARAGEDSGEVAWTAAGFETGDFLGLDRTSAQLGSLTVSGDRTYGGGYSGLATYLGGGLKGYARAVVDVAPVPDKDLWYGAAFYLPSTFAANQGGDVELLRWDNVPSRGEEADFGGIVLSGSDKRARLFRRQGINAPRETVMGPFDVPRGGWFFLEVRQRLASTNPLNEVYLDGRRIGRSGEPNSFGSPAEALRYGLVTIDQLRPAQLWIDRIVARLTAPNAACDWSINASPAYTEPSYLPLAKYEDRWPVGCWRAYNDSSPFNQRIPANPAVDPGSASMVKRLTDAGDPAPRRAGVADTTQDFYKPTYWASDTDPLVTLAGSSTSPISGEQIHVPAGARPAAGSDGHMTIVQSDGWEYDLYAAQPIDAGVLRYDSGRKIPVDGDGLNSAATSARFGNLGGVIRAQELQAGRINHALFMTASTIATNSVYPAAKSDGNDDPALGYPPMGTRFQLVISDAELAAFPAWKRAVLRALRDYGGYLGDSTSSPWTVGALESGTSYTSFGLEDHMVSFARWAYESGQDGISLSGGDYRFDVASGVDWANRLRVIQPCVTAGTC
jgi:hypothetical protein